MIDWVLLKVGCPYLSGEYGLAIETWPPPFNSFGWEGPCGQTDLSDDVTHWCKIITPEIPE